MLNGMRMRLRGLLSREEMECDLDDELRFHLEKEIEQRCSEGMSKEEARMAALRSFGGVEQIKEQARDIRRARLLEDMWQDLRYAVRMMRKAPAFTSVAVLSLALGIGANTALFSMLDSVLLKTLPVKEPERLVLFQWQAGRDFRTSGVSGYGSSGWVPEGMRGSSSFQPRVFELLREQDGPLSDIFAFANMWELSALIDGQAEMIDGQIVSGGYFAGLGVPAALGRTITESDDNASAAPVAVLTHRYWKERFNSDPSVIGKQISLNKTSFTIIGVTPPAFTGTLQVSTRPAIVVPLAFEPILAGERTMMGREGRPPVWWLHLMGRLKPGATIEQARESLNAPFQALALELMPPPRRENEPAQLEPKDYPSLLAISGSRGMMEQRWLYSSTIYMLFGVVGLVLLVACANVANLLLARAALRGSEITLRLAVGAGRGRLIRQLLTESVLLSAMGGAAGLCFALWGKDALALIGDSGGSILPADIEYGISWRVLGFTIAISLLTGIMFGLAPAWRATRLDLTTALKESTRSLSGMSRSRLSKTLIIAQVAMSLLLLVGAGLFIRTVRNLQQVEVGFNQENMLLFTLQPGASGYKKDGLLQLYQQVSARLDALPGASGATFSRIPLIANNIHNISIILPGETAQSNEEHLTNKQIVRENYLEIMEIPLLRGRTFNEQDNERAPKVAIVSETLARKFFPDEDPIGKRIGMDAKTIGTIEIVGIARDTKYNNQRDEIEPLLYTPWRQENERISGMVFALRAQGDPTALASAVRQAVRDVDSNLPVTDVITQEAQANRTLAQERTFAQLLSFFGVIALLLASIGLYGVMAYSVAQRTGEIGIRMALGAQAGHVLRLVIWQGLKLVLIGLVVGSVAAFLLKQVVESQLYGVRATDPLTFAAVGALLTLIALFACWIPARRAARVDPMIALRNE